MKELVKCARCQKIIIDEEYELHKCSPRINGIIKIIEVDFWITRKHPKTNEDLVSATGLDGTTYWVVKRSKRASDRQPYSPTNLQQRDATTEDGNTTVILY